MKKSFSIIMTVLFALNIFIRYSTTSYASGGTIIRIYPSWNYERNILVTPYSSSGSKYGSFSADDGWGERYGVTVATLNLSNVKNIRVGWNTSDSGSEGVGTYSTLSLSIGGRGLSSGSWVNVSSLKGNYSISGEWYQSANNANPNYGGNCNFYWSLAYIDVELMFTASYSPTGFTNQPVTLTWDNIGQSQTEVYLDDVLIDTRSDFSMTINQNGTYKLKEKLNNSEATVTVNNLDFNNPVIESFTYTTIPPSQTTKVKVNAVDN